MQQKPAQNPVKYIFVTGGVVSSLGKGLAAASIGALLEGHGYKVALQKFDPYINVDPGTMSPYQHGEVYVTDDGAETDLDLGHYERFTNQETTRNNNWTTGKIYLSVIQKERRGEPPGALEVLGRVDADAVVRGLDGLDPDAVLERAQLLERFGAFERRLRQRGEPQQARAAVRVQPDVPPGRRLRLAGARVRDRRAREIQRDVIAIDDELGDVRVAQLGGVVNAATERRHLQRRVDAERRDRFVDHRGLDERLVSLHVDDHVAVERPRDFGQSVGPALVRRGRHPRVAAEGAHRVRDALVVGRDDDAVDRTRRRGAAVDVLDHRASGDVRQSFARQSRRMESCGDDDDGGEGDPAIGGPEVSSRVHEQV